MKNYFCKHLRSYFYALPTESERYHVNALSCAEKEITEVGGFYHEVKKSN